MAARVSAEWGFRGVRLIGIDSSPGRLRDIARGAVDLLPLHHAQLACASAGDGFRLTSDATAVRAADAVVICVPTPVDARREPDLTAFRRLRLGPLRARGLTVDEDVYVAFAPERIDPGNEDHTLERTPRLVGGAGPHSGRAAAALLAPTASVVRTVPDPETAEMAKPRGGPASPH
ncbi:hypothetical protein ABZY14_03975 [Streptomyces sp. NPDC006617]|uniref:hypothetical protein n=1 Tax=Streptomyces sp. NPDC006617 TaxID=3155354 RepID=UPI0033A2F4BD